MSKKHMLKVRSGRDITTKCGLLIKLGTGQYLPDVNVTGWHRDVTCPRCMA